MIEVLHRGVLDVPLMDVQPFPERRSRTFLILPRDQDQDVIEGIHP